MRQLIIPIVAVCWTLALCFTVVEGQERTAATAERVILLQAEKGTLLSSGELSLDGTLCLIAESRIGRMPLPAGTKEAAPKLDQPLWEKRLRVFEMKTGKVIWQWQSDRTVRTVAWTKRNHLFVVVGPLASGAWEIGGFDPRNEKSQVFQYRLAKPWHVHVAMAPDGMTMAVEQELYGGGRRLERANLVTGEVTLLRQTKSEDQLSMVGYSPDGSHLVLSGLHKKLLCAVKTGTLYREFPYPSLDGRVSLSTDGRLLAIFDKRVVWVWDIDAGKRVATLDGLRKPLWNAPFPKATSMTALGSVRFLGGGSILCIETGHLQLVGYHDISSVVMTSPFHSQLHFFDTRTWQRLHVLDNTCDPHASRDGRFLLATSKRSDKQGVLVFDLQTKRERWHFPEDKGGFNTRGFVRLPNGQEAYFSLQSQQPPVQRRTILNWFGMRRENESLFTVSFWNPLDDKPFDRWTFLADELNVTVSPQRDRLLLHITEGSGRQRLELYAPPVPRQP